MKKKSRTTLRKLPSIKTEAQAAAFVERADLTAYDLSQMHPARFEFSRKEARVNMRIPRQLLIAVKAAALQAAVRAVQRSPADCEP